MQNNIGFFTSADPKERRCPLCGQYHSVEKTKELRPSKIFDTLHIFTMFCTTEKKSLRHESLYDKSIIDMWFERKDVLL